MILRTRPPASCSRGAGSHAADLQFLVAVRALCKFFAIGEQHSFRMPGLQERHVAIGSVFSEFDPTAVLTHASYQ